MTARCPVENDDGPMIKCAKLDGQLREKIDNGVDAEMVGHKQSVDEAQCSRDAKKQQTKVPSDCPYEFTAVRPIFHGRWMGAKQVDFKDTRGQQGIWQVAYRTSKLKHALSDGVLCIPVVKSDKGKKTSFILIKQFRIPVMSWCLEFPAGLLDPGETMEECAIRELKEETGYTAHKVVKMTKACALDPGLVDATGNCVLLEIDADSPENANPTQDLGHGEHIERFVIPEDELYEFVAKKSKEGVVIEMAVQTFVMARQLAKLMG